MTPLAAVAARPVRVALLDDHPVVLNGLAVRLSSELGIDIVGLYGRSADLLRRLERGVPDVIILDFELHQSDVNGASLLRGLRQRHPACVLLAYSSHDDPESVTLMRQAGAHAFVSKRQDLSELVQALYALTGRQALPSAPSPPPRLPGLDTLSAREYAVISCYLQGMTVSQIADRFHRSIKTVSTQKTAACRKLGVTNDQALFDLKTRLPD